MQTIDDSAVGDKRAEIARLRKIFGSQAVLLPCKEKTPRDKAWRKMKGWEKTEPAVMDDPAWMAELLRKPQTGLLCGRSVVVVDLDALSALEGWRAAFPTLRATAITGQPGRAKYFFRVPAGTEGRKRLLYMAGKKIGELLATGSQAIVAGIHHETGQPYQLADDSPPLHTTMEQVLEWLRQAGITLKRSRTKCDVECRMQDAELQDAAMQNTGGRENGLVVTSSAHTASVAAEVLEQMALEKRGKARLSQVPQPLRGLYTTHLGERYPAHPGERNDFIVTAIPALIRRVSPSLAVKLTGLCYDLHRELFENSRDEHCHEATEHCRNCLHTYRLALLGDEGAVYDALEEMEQTAFRIARDLARLDAPIPPPQFILSAEELGRRCENHVMVAYRLLQRFRELRLIELLALGKRRITGQPAIATLWKWRLSLEPWPSSSFMVQMPIEIGRKISGSRRLVRWT